MVLWGLHHDNAPAYSSHLSQSFLMKLGILVICQPPYSPDMTPCDFWLFLKLKALLKGFHFESGGEIIQNQTAELNTIPSKSIPGLFLAGNEWWSKCVKVQGAFFKGDPAR